MATKEWVEAATICHKFRKLSCIADAGAKLFWFVFVFVAQFDFIDVCLSLTKLNGNLSRNQGPLSCGSFEDIIDEVKIEFLLLYDLNTSKNLD